MVILAIFAVGIPVSSALAIRSSQAHTRLRDLATQTLRAELGVDASLGRVQIELYPFGIVARDVTLDDPIYGRLADAAQIRIQPSLRAFLRGSIDVNALELRGAHVRLVFRDGELRNVPRIKSGGGGGGITLPFRQLVIRDASLAIDAEPIASGDLVVREASVIGERGGVIDIQLDAPSGHARYAGGRDEIRGIRGHVELASDALRILGLDVRAGPLALVVREGLVPLPPPNPLDPPPAEPRSGAHGYHGEVELDYDLAHLGTLPLPFEMPPLSGQVQVRARVHEDSAHGQQVSGTVRIEGGHIAEFGIGESARLTIEADREQVRVTSGEVRVAGAAGGTVNVTGTLGLSEELPLDVTAEVHGFSFANLMSLLAVTDGSLVEWIFDGRMNLRGSIRDVELEGPIDLRSRDFAVTMGAYDEPGVGTVIAIPRGNFRGRWSIRRDAIRFTNLVGDLPRSRITGNVHLGFDNRLGVSARAEPGDLGDIGVLAGFPIAGTGAAEVEIDGYFFDPRVRGHMRFDGFEFASFRLGDIDTDAVLDRDGLGVTFRDLKAVKNDSRYGAEEVYLDFHDNRFRMTGELTLGRLHLSDFYHVFGLESDERFTPYGAVVSGTARMLYSNGYPGDLPDGTIDVDMELGLRDVRLDAFGFEQGQLAGRLHWIDRSRGAHGAELEIEHAELMKGGGTVMIAGRMDLGGRLSMVAAADAIPLREIEGVGTRFPDIEGLASATGTVGGTTDAMRVDMDVGLAGVAWMGRPLGDARAYVRMTQQDDPWIAGVREGDPCAMGRAGLRAGRWPADPPMRTIDGMVPRMSVPGAFVICGTALDEHVRLDLAVGRTSRLPIRGAITLDEVALGELFPRGSGLHGQVSGSVTIADGDMTAPETLTASIAIDELEVGRQDLVLSNRGPMRIEIAEGIASFERARLEAPNTRIRIHGHYALPTSEREGGLALTLRAGVDLSLLPRITQLVTQAEGSMQAQLSLSGPLFDPELFGQAEILDGMLRLSGMPAPIEDLGAVIEFSARSVLINEVHARVAGGQVRGSGEAALADGAIERYRIGLDAAGISLVPADGLEVGLDAELELGWIRGDRLAELGGTVRIARLAYTRNIDLGTTLGQLQRTQRAQVARYDPSAERVAVDLRVVNEEPLQVRNNLVDAQLRIDDSQQPYRIVGTDQRYGLVGSLAFTRGAVFFRNTRFDVLSGSLEFDDPTRIDPNFRVLASTEIARRTSDLSAPRWRVRLDAHGSMSSFEIETSSDPDLPQEDIVMLLAVGMTRSEFSSLQASDVGGTAALEALNAVTGLNRELNRSLPMIDEISLQSGYSRTTGRTEPQIAIGRRIADRVRITATTGVGTGQSRDFRAGIDVQLTDETGVQCSYDNNGATTSLGNVGCDVRFQLDFE